jgi:hypothetical protein
MSEIGEYTHYSVLGNRQYGSRQVRLGSVIRRCREAKAVTGLKRGRRHVPTWRPARSKYPLRQWAFN